MRRRTIIAGLFGIVAATVLSRRAAAGASKTRLICSEQAAAPGHLRPAQAPPR